VFQFGNSVTVQDKAFHVNNKTIGFEQFLVLLSDAVLPEGGGVFRCMLSTDRTKNGSGSSVATTTLHRWTPYDLAFPMTPCFH
jgi:hypothetical protein